MNRLNKMRDDGCRLDAAHRSEAAATETSMFGPGRQLVALFVDRTTQQWVIRDPEGAWWRLPTIENCWHHREPFQLSEEADLNSVPGHYRHALNLPF